MKWHIVVIALAAVFLLFGCVSKGTTSIRVDTLDCPYSARISDAIVNLSSVTLPVDTPDEACAIATQVWSSLCPAYPINGSCAPGSGNYSKWMPEFNLSCKDCNSSQDGGASISGAYFFINKTTGEIWGTLSYTLHTAPGIESGQQPIKGLNGTMCGGIAGFKCDDGYYCQYSNGYQPSYPDEAGTCVQCPKFVPASPKLTSDCMAMGGVLVAEKGDSGCTGPPKCKVG